MLSDDFPIIQDLIEKNHYDDALKLISQEIDNTQNKNNMFNLYFLNLLKSIIYREQGKYDLAKDNLNYIIKNSIKIQNVYTLARIELAYNLYYLSDYVGSIEQIKWLEYLISSYMDNKDLFSKNIVAEFFHVKGLNFRVIGDYNSALDYFMRGYQVRNEIHDQKGIAYSLYNIAEIYSLEDKLDVALKYYNQSYDTFNELGHILGKSITLTKMGTSMINEGDRKTGYIRLFEGFENAKRTQNRRLLAFSLKELISNLIIDKEYEKSLILLKDLKDIKNESQDSLIENRYNFCQALYYKNQNRIRDKAKAQSLFLKIINSELVNFETVVLAIRHYCELLFEEIIITENIDIIEELKNYISKLISITESNNSLNILIDSLKMKSKLCLLDNHIEESIQLIEKAIQIAQRNNLDKILESLKKDYKELKANRKKIDNDEPLDLKSRIEETKIIDYLHSVENIVRRLPYKE